MSVSGLLLGVLNIILLVVILVLVGAICAWVLSALGWPVPANVQKLFFAVVALVALIAFVALLLGSPILVWRIVGLNDVLAAGATGFAGVVRRPA